MFEMSEMILFISNISNISNIFTLLIIFLYGSDSYRIKQAKDGLISRHKTKYASGVNLFSFDLSEINGLEQLEESLRNSSFFNEHKLIVCKNTFNKKTSADRMAEYIKKYSLSDASDITLMVGEDLAEKDLALKHKELFKVLSDTKNTVKATEALTGTALNTWIKTEAETRGCKINDSVAEGLVNIVGNDSWALINELDKLSTYRGGDITANDVKTMVSPKIDLSIFDLIDALAVKNRPKVLELLYRELKNGRDPYYILTMIIFQFRNILTVKDLKERGLSEPEISRKTKIHPFVIKKSLRSPFTTKESIDMYGKLLTLENGFKTGGLDLENSLYNIVLS